MAAHGPSSLRGRPVHMFLLAGQSNMSGRGELPEFPEEKDERLLVLGSDGTWKTAQHPLHYDKPEKAGVGPGLAFARGVVAQDSDFDFCAHGCIHTVSEAIGRCSDAEVVRNIPDREP